MRPDETRDLVRFVGLLKNKNNSGVLAKIKFLEETRSKRHAYVSRCVKRCQDCISPYKTPKWAVTEWFLEGIICFPSFPKTWDDMTLTICFPKTRIIPSPSPSLRPRPNHQPLKDGPSPRCTGDRGECSGKSLAKSEAKKWNPTESNRIQHPIPSQSHRLNKFKLGRVTRLPGKRFRMDSAWILHGFWQGMSRYKKRKKWGCIGSIRFLSVSCSAIRAVFARQGFHVFGVTVPDCGKQQRPMRGKCNGRVRAIGRRKKGEGALSLLLMIENWENQQKRREGTSSKVLPPKHATRVRLDATSCYNSGPVRWRGQSLQPETAKDRELPRQAGRVPSSQRCKPDLE